MKTLKDIGDIRGKTVFVRSDFNVPVTAGKIDNDFRLKQALPTIQLLREKGAKVILASHIETEEEPTLEPVAAYFRNVFPVTFVQGFYPNRIDSERGAMKEGDVLLLENLRQYPHEKSNDDKFAAHLASFADIYVNDAFATAHRPHASIVGVPKHIPGYAGLLLEAEVRTLSKAFSPNHPFVFILGGAKFDTKLPLIEKFLDIADVVFVGGALANDILKARGMEVGTSVLSEGADVSRVANHSKLRVPMDVIVQSEKGREAKRVEEVLPGDKILDAGPHTIDSIELALRDARFILWNGPLGYFEGGFREGTDALAQLVANSPATSVVGGGDTVSAISALKIDDKFSFISTGGGAMLDFLSKGTLPAVEALK